MTDTATFGSATTASLAPATAPATQVTHPGFYASESTPSISVSPEFGLVLK